MNIEITDFLSDEEIKKIVEDEFRNKVKQVFNTERDVERIISNLGYENVFKIIDKEIPNFKELIKEQTKKQCEEISTYHVFRQKDDYGQKNSLAQMYLNEAVEKNKDIIINKVKEILNELGKQDIAGEILEIIGKKIDYLFQKGE